MQIPFTPDTKEQQKFNKQGYHKQDFALGIPDILKLSAIVLLCVFFIASCSSTDDSCAKSELQLQEQIRTQTARIASLEDSLHKAINPSGLVAVTDSGSTIASTATTTTETSFYKNEKATTHHKTHAEVSKDFPGEFPEGSSKVLTEKNIKFLSQWGIKVMLNEIYARHGMIFTDQSMIIHFRHAAWYKGTKNTVDDRLSATERKNVRFINNYKFTPQITT